eukprot:TRINITY_DN50917_c0_g1_i1.p1 TRINITY_DN50917_c0_g1~~TRINITY_DN50917_c0_g1_i1.p1  ORF type:complete len:191 (+),score=38.25 TRINITY_DN50917_c0_g1_i1:60-575(+)
MAASMSDAEEEFAGPEIIGHRRIKAELVSIRDESGHRELQVAVVAGFEVTMPTEYGKSITRGPSLLCGDDGAILEDVEGKYFLHDGKSITVYLQRQTKKGIKGLRNQKLLKDLLEGADYELVKFPPHQKSRLYIVGWNISTHGAMNNKFLESTIATKVRYVNDVKLTVPGG